MGIDRKVIALAAGVMAAAASLASADIWHHDWGYADNGGGAGSIDDQNMYVTGGNVGVPGYTYYQTTIWARTHMEFSLDYSSPDGGEWDYFFIAVNGAVFPLMYNKDQQNGKRFIFEFDPGDTVALGVYTADGTSGAGNSHVYAHSVWTLLDADELHWSPWSQYGSGSVDLPPPGLHVTGGDAGFADRTEGYLYTTIPMWALAGGSYSSPDSGDYDKGYFFTQAEGVVPFINNDTQGNFSPFFVYVPELNNLSYGVATDDGIQGAGDLNVSYFLSYVFPGTFGHFPWWPEDTADGWIEWGNGVINAHGGNSGYAGYTQFYTQSYYDHHVEAGAYYWCDGDEGDYDRAYYVVNGVRTYIANNDHQGYYNLDFEVPAGAYFGFGVETSDGLVGGGHLSVWALRAWVLPMPTACYADCDGNGKLDLFDFLCFQNQFVGGKDYADCDGNAKLDLFDFLCFQNEFVGGC